MARIARRSAEAGDATRAGVLPAAAGFGKLGRARVFFQPISGLWASGPQCVGLWGPEPESWACAHCWLRSWARRVVRVGLLVLEKRKVSWVAQ